MGISTNAVSARRPSLSKSKGSGSHMPAFYRGLDTFQYREPNKMCSHCGNRDHTIEICFKKHGYPPGWGTRKSTTSIHNPTDDTDAEGVIPVAPQSFQTPVQSFSPEQIQQLLTLLQHSNTTPMTSLSPIVEASASQSQVLEFSNTSTSGINLSQNLGIVP